MARRRRAAVPQGRGNEPVRVPVWVAAALTAAGTFLVQWAQGGDWRIALGTAILGLGLVGGSGELGRKGAYGPVSHEDEVVDAVSHALAQQRGDGPGPSGEGAGEWPGGEAV